MSDIKIDGEGNITKVGSEYYEQLTPEAKAALKDVRHCTGKNDRKYTCGKCEGCKGVSP